MDDVEDPYFMIGRQDELEKITDSMKDKKGGIIYIYGYHNVGKTLLIHNIALQGDMSVYHQLPTNFKTVDEWFKHIENFSYFNKNVIMLFLTHPYTTNQYGEQLHKWVMKHKRHPPCWVFIEANIPPFSGRSGSFLWIKTRSLIILLNPLNRDCLEEYVKLKYPEVDNIPILIEQYDDIPSIDKFITYNSSKSDRFYNSQDIFDAWISHSDHKLDDTTFLEIESLEKNVINFIHENYTNLIKNNIELMYDMIEQISWSDMFNLSQVSFRERTSMLENVHQYDMYKVCGTFLSRICNGDRKMSKRFKVQTSKMWSKQSITQFKKNLYISRWKDADPEESRTWNYDTAFYKSKILGWDINKHTGW